MLKKEISELRQVASRQEWYTGRQAGSNQAGMVHRQAGSHQAGRQTRTVILAMDGKECCLMGISVAACLIHLMSPGGWRWVGSLWHVRNSQTVRSKLFELYVKCVAACQL